MVKTIKVENFSEEELRMRYRELTYKDSWDSECELCDMPDLLHNGVCTRATEIGEIEYVRVREQRKTFKDKMKPVRMWHKDEEEKIRRNNDLLT